MIVHNNLAMQIKPVLYRFLFALWLMIDLTRTLQVANEFVAVVIKLVVVIWTLLNQMHTGQRPAHAWFLEIAFVCKSVCVCVLTSEGTNNYSHEIKLLWMGVAIVTKHVVNAC